MEYYEVGENVYLTNDHCLLLKNHDTVIIADLHLGYEGVLQREGVSIPRYQKSVILQRLETILQKYRPRRIIVNGDFKHNFSKNLQQEWQEVKDVLSFLSSKTMVSLIRGNHDNYLATIASYCNVPLSWEEQIEDMRITHGHRCINDDSTFLIIAHEHPSLHMRDDVGALVKLPCFLVSQDVVVLPAFSPLAMGTDVVSADQSDFLSPVLQRKNVEDFRLFAVSEIGLLDFATVRELRRVNNRRYMRGF